MNSGGWSARWQRDRVGLETERELTGGVHVKTHHDSLGRETYKSVGARNVEQFRRSYTWGIGNRLHATEDGLTGRRVRYDYDEFDNLLSAEYKQGNDVEFIYRIPDRIGNLFETREKDDRKYGAGSRLTEDRDYFYHYDCEGNLVFKEFRTLDWAGVSVPLGVQKAHLEEELGITFRAFGAGWRYDWQSDGMLSRVVRPDGKEVSFAYDALGRRTEKTYEGVTTHFVWDGNVPLHEWQEVSSDAGRADVTTWLSRTRSFLLPSSLPTARASPSCLTTLVLPCRHLTITATRFGSRSLISSAEKKGRATIIPPSFRLSIKVSMRTLRRGCTTTASAIMIHVRVITSARTL